jgi:hypothetical protein
MIRFHEPRPGGITIAESLNMPRTHSLRILAPIAAVGILGFAVSADAQEGPPPVTQAAPQPQYPQAPQYQPQPQYQQAPQYQQQPQYPQQQGPTVVIQQQYPAPVYQPPGYPQQPYYSAPSGPPQSVAAPGPRVIRDWDDSQAIPQGFHVEEHPRKGLVIAGAVTFGAMYLFTALGASIANDSGSPANALYVPAIGPFIQMGHSSNTTGGFFLALDGIVQCAGVAMFTIGLAAPKADLVRDDVGVIKFHLSPIVAQGSTGMGLVGTF